MSEGEKNSAISTFFNGKSVFITGATGFIGKQIIEKLLRSCSGVDRIYILVRSKRGLHPHERVQQFCSLVLFERVRSLTPEFQSKIIPMIGDITKVNLGLTSVDEQILIDNCDVVINSGASIRFTAPLKESIKSNVYSVQNLITLCKKMKQLQVLVHISTAYVHCYRTDMNEIIYPTEENPNVLLESLDSFDDRMFDHLAEKVANKYPNTYTYTKSLAEYFILQHGKNLPIAIIRPSIVGATWKEPLPGWIDNYSGATGIMIAIGKCLMRIGHGSPIVDHPMIPVDTVANMTVAIAWFTATTANRNSYEASSPMVYNCSTGTNHMTCLSLGDFFNTVATEEKAIGFENYSTIEPSMKLTMNRPYYIFRRFLSESLPAYLMDIVACLTMRQTKMVTLSGKVNNLKDTMQYFCQYQWIFTIRNSQSLFNQMNDIDREEFNFNLIELNWPSYIRNYCLGIKKYLLKEDLVQTSSKHSCTKTTYAYSLRRILASDRRLLLVLFFFVITWIIRQMFLKKLRIIWNVLHAISRKLASVAK